MYLQDGHEALAPQRLQATQRPTLRIVLRDAPPPVPDGRAIALGWFDVIRLAERERRRDAGELLLQFVVDADSDRSSCDREGPA